MSSRSAPPRRSRREKVPSLKVQESVSEIHYHHHHHHHHATGGPPKPDTVGSGSSTGSGRAGGGGGGGARSKQQNNAAAAASSAGRASSSFPVRLYEMLTREATSGALQWSSDGSFFTVTHSDPAIKGILKKYFGFEGQKAFRRRLNIYGFERNHISGDQYEVKHNCFHRDAPELAETIIRVDVDDDGNDAGEHHHQDDHEKKQKVHSKDANNSDVQPDDVASCGSSVSSLRAHISAAAARQQQGHTKEARSAEGGTTEQTTAGALAFPALMHKVATEESKRSGAITWSDDGRALYIHPRHPDLPGVLQKHFHHSNHESLHRQLNVYGWKKPRSGPYKGGFLREHFHRDRYSDVAKIKRRPGRHDRARHAAATAAAAAAAAAKKRTKARQQDQHGTDSNSTSSSSTSARETIHDYDLSTYATMEDRSVHLDRMDVDHEMDATTGEDDDGAVRHDDDDEEDEEVMDSQLDEDRDSSAFLAVSKTPRQEEDRPGSRRRHRDADDGASASSASSETTSPGGDDDDNKMPAVEAPALSTGAAPVEAKYQVYQKVFSRDKDGVMYEAVIRRRLYGPNHNLQVQMGFETESTKHANELMQTVAEASEKHTWHYFVHYNKWNVNWDRWVSEDMVYLPTPHVRAYAARLLAEHRALRQEMIAALKKRRRRQGQKHGIDGLQFMREWRRRMVKVGKETHFEEEKELVTAATEGEDDDDGGGATTELKATETLEKTPANKGDSSQGKKKLFLETAWTKAAIAMEKDLRENSLTSTSKRNPPQMSLAKIVLPFSLKKILVDQWEVISQCDMMPQLPSKVTVRDALNKYLESKGVVLLDDSLMKGDRLKGTESSPAKTPAETSGATDGAAESSQARDVPVPVSASPKSVASGATTPKKIDGEARKEWVDMCEGIAKLFDEALPFRLLYREEAPQSKVLETLPEYAMRRFSDIYGCEHLLRLFVRLPEMLTDFHYRSTAVDGGDGDGDGDGDDKEDDQERVVLSEKELRTIVAKVNDLVRFLHKKQATLFAQTYRKPNDLEVKERQRATQAKTRKRRRNTAAKQQQQSQGSATSAANKKLRTNPASAAKDPSSTATSDAQRQ